MTAPPGGPYDPYGNPYGQQPYWGGQPQGGGYQYPAGGQYPPVDPYANPQGGVDPYGATYVPPQYPQTGPQGQPGWPGGGYPAGPPPGGPRGSKTPWLIIAGIAVLGIIALVVILVIGLSNGNKSNTANPPETSATTSAPTSGPSGQQTATDCTPNVSGGDKPTTDTVSAGKLQFQASAAPGWQAISDDQSPNLIDAVGVAQEVPGASQWVMQAEVAITNFVPSMDVAAQASKLFQCVVAGPGYAGSSPTPGPTKTSSMTVDGTKAARIDADVAIADPSRGIKGDSVVIIAVDTKPVTIFLGATAIGDTASAAIISKVIGTLKVSRK
jgi:hypothetical protein